jgi:hypothetical protein
MIEKPTILTLDEVQRLLSVAANRQHANAARDHAFLAVMAVTGRAPGEVVNWTVQDAHKAVADCPGVLEVVTAYSSTMLDLSPTAPLFGFSVRQAERLFDQYAEQAQIDARYSLFSLCRTARSNRVMKPSADLDALAVTTRVA